MPSLKDIKKRVGSVKSTQKITRAMKMVAAAKLRRAQESIIQLRPYAYKIRDLISHLVEVVPHEDHPLLAHREPKKVLLLVVTSDRGLCGAFNANINRQTERYISENRALHDEVSLAIVGRKGQDYFRRRDVTIHSEHREVLSNPVFERAQVVAADIIDAFTGKNLDACYLIYNEFKSAISQSVVVEPVLPIPIPEQVGEDSFAQSEYIYEPNKKELLSGILPLYVEVQIFRAILESLAGEMGARMTAMDAATKNAKDLIKKLTLQYNKARQAAITTELIEIISGAEAL